MTVNHDVVGSSPTWGAKELRVGFIPTLNFLFLSVGREQPGNRISDTTDKLDVATNNLNGCWLGRGRLLRRVQLGEPRKKR